MIIIDQWIQMTVIDSYAILVAVMSECWVKRVICKTWTGLSAGTMANSADPDQMPQNAASDQGLHALLKFKEVKWNSPKSSFRTIFLAYTQTSDPPVLSMLWYYLSVCLNIARWVANSVDIWIDAVFCDLSWVCGVCLGLSVPIHRINMASVLSTSLRKTFFAWRFILNENILFWMTISYQKPFVFSVSVFCSQICTLKLNLWPNIGLNYAISIVKWFFGIFD